MDKKQVDTDKKQIQKFISDRFVAIRTAKTKGISARQLSQKLGRSPQYINQIESGRKMPSIEMIFAFCNEMKVWPAVFFDAGYKCPVQYKELTKYLDKLTPDELEEILTVAKRYAQNKR